jgi:alanyl-tRNA synthetase
MLLNRLAAMMAEDFYEKGKSFGDSTVRLVVKSWTHEDNDLIRRIMKDLLKRDRLLICLVNTVNETVYWSIGCSGEINFDFDRHKSGLLALINGKGGGRHPLWQGTGTKAEGIEKFLTMFRNLPEQI